MKEYLLSIRNAAGGKDHLSGTDHLAFLQACERYIEALQAAGQLIAAQPLTDEGVVLCRSGNLWEESAPSGAIQQGYYHIRAESLEEAVRIARLNPEFAYVPSASIEIRGLKAGEEETGFDYPGRKG